MTSVRLIALDLDGTLLDDRKEIHPENLRALREARDRGVLVAISSGRMIPRIEPVQDKLGLDCILVAYNGGKVVGTRAESREVLHHQPLPSSVADEFVEFSQTEDYLLNFYYEDRLYADDSPRRRPFMEIYSGRTGAEYHLGDLEKHRGKDPTKLILLADPPERDRLFDRFTEQMGERAAITKSDPEYLEIMAPGVSKAAGLAGIARKYGFAMDEVLAVGDADNDLDMLEASGIGVAVANARETTKRVADFVTERSNNDGAVAEAVDRFVL